MSYKVGDTKEYEMVLQDETPFQAHKRLLLRLAHDYDLVYNDGKAVLGKKIINVDIYPGYRVTKAAPNIVPYVLHRGAKMRIESQDLEYVHPAIAEGIAKYDYNAMIDIISVKDAGSMSFQEWICPKDFLVTNTYRNFVAVWTDEDEREAQYDDWLFSCPNSYYRKYNPLQKRQMASLTNFKSGKEVGKVYPYIPSLMYLCLQRQSCYYQSYSGFTQPFVYNCKYTAESGLKAFIRNIPRWNIAPAKHYNFNWTFQAMVFYYTHCVQLREEKWAFMPNDINLFKFKTSGNGKVYYDKAVKDTTVEVGGVKINFTKHGNRQEAATLWLRRKFRNMRIAFNETKYCVPIKKRLIHGNATIAPKIENKSEIADGDWSEQANAATAEKMRMLFMVQDWMNQDLCGRHAFERTYFTPGFFPMVHNRIGQKWTQGGAHLLAKLLCVDHMDQYARVVLPNSDNTVGGDLPSCEWKKVLDGDQLIADGDVSKLDMSIKALMLLCYMMMGSIWVAKEETHMYRMYRYLLESAAEALAGKHCSWFTDFALIIGVMPSGSFETSHGNTWIMQVFFFLTFIFKTLSECTPEERAQFFHYNSLRRIIIVLFGDDFLYSYPKCLRGKFGIYEFEKFLKEFFHTILKKCKEYGTLITYLPIQDGKVSGVKQIYGHEVNCHMGPTFLKKYIIPWNNFFLEQYAVPAAPRYTVWRPFIQYVQKVAVPNGEKMDRSKCTPVQNLARIVGLMYDNIGVDPLAHRFLSFQYEYSWNWFRVNYTDRTSRRAILKVLVDEVSKYCERMNITSLFSVDRPDRMDLLKLHSVSIKEHTRPFRTATWQ
jgi:hypothetical protein